MSIVFLVMATWALGMFGVPLTAWQSTGGGVFYVDLGSVKNVSAVYVLVKQGSINYAIYTGQPGSWNFKREGSVENYYQWLEIRIDDVTQFVRFVFQASNGEVAEISALDSDYQKIVVKAIGGENSEDTSLISLIDEQDKIECPPTYESETYFDEIYYVRTAEDYLDHRDAYEWTQPPLGKLIIAAGIFVFGFTPFGWRIIGVLFAMLMIPIAYLFGKRMFGTWIGAFGVAFLLAFDFMHFTMGRIGTIDTFLVFFSFLSQFFFFSYLKNVLSQGWETSTRPLLLSTVFFALGLSTKWYALLGFLGQLFILLVLRVRGLLASKWGMPRREVFFSRPFFSVVTFLFIALGIYLLTYVPHMIAGHSLGDVFRLQWWMYNYHATLLASHPFASPWWSWPLITRPVWLYVSNLPGGSISTIAAMGNPAVWWVGLASVAFAVEEAVRKKNHDCLFIATMFSFQWLPYALISRVLFLYAFYSNVPIMILATVYFINKYWGVRRWKIIAFFFFIVVAVLFAVFYPVISGVPASRNWIDSLKWMRSWVF